MAASARYLGAPDGKSPSSRAGSDLLMSFSYSPERRRQRLREPQSSVIDAFEDTLILDLKPLTFIDCSGLHAVFDLWEVSRRNGLSLQIVGARGVVRRVLHLAPLEDVLPLVDEPSPAP